MYWNKYPIGAYKLIRDSLHVAQSNFSIASN